MDPYQVLGVARDAEVDEIRSVYRQLARTFHPDVNADAGAVERFRRITDAYLLLMDPARRAKHDRSCRAVGEETEADLGLRVAGIGLGGLLGVSVRMRTRPLFADDLDEEERPLRLPRRK